MLYFTTQHMYILCTFNERSFQIFKSSIGCPLRYIKRPVEALTAPLWTLNGRLLRTSIGRTCTSVEITLDNQYTSMLSPKKERWTFIGRHSLVQKAPIEHPMAVPLGHKMDLLRIYIGPTLHIHSRCFSIQSIQLTWIFWISNIHCIPIPRMMVHPHFLL